MTTKEQDRDDANFELAMGMPIGCLRPEEQKRQAEAEALKADIAARLQKLKIKVREPWYVRWMRPNGS